MDIILWFPNQEKDISKRVSDLNEYGVFIHPWDIEDKNPEGNGNFFQNLVIGIVNKVQEGFPYSWKTYDLRNRGRHFFKGGGCEKVIGLLRYSQERYTQEEGISNDVFKVFFRLDIPICFSLKELHEKLGIENSGGLEELSEKDFIEPYLEVHLLDQENLYVPNLDSRFSYFLIPGFNYARRVCAVKESIENKTLCCV